MEDVRSTVLTPLAYPVSLEQENHETFYDVTMRTPMRIPVILRVGTTHIRVTSVSALFLAIFRFHADLSLGQVVANITRDVLQVHRTDTLGGCQRHL